MSALDLLVAARNAVGGRAYKLGSVPAAPQYPYSVLSNAPAAPQVRDLGGSGEPAGRFTVQHFGRSIDSVDAIADDTFDTFDGKPLPLPGDPVAWQEISTTPYRDPDDRGVLNVLHTYRF